MRCASTIPRRTCATVRLSPAKAPAGAPLETHFVFADRQRLPRARHRALRRRGLLPQHAGRRHVSQLSRHRRGAALHPRPRPPALGDARRRPARRRLPEPRRPRSPRPLPQLQSLQIRVPRPGRHGRLQVRVPGAALQRPPAPAPPLHFWFRRPPCPLRLARSRPHQRPAYRPAHQPAHQAHRRRRAGAPTAAPGAEKLPEDAKFIASFHESQPKAQPQPQEVLLWPDTWNNYYHPQTLSAAESVLTQAGFQVETPQGHICCGRPLYDFGLLAAARSYLANVLRPHGSANRSRPAVHLP